MHFFHERAEKAKVVMRGGAKRSAVRGWVHVRNVGTDGEVYSDGYFEFVGVVEHAGLRVRRVKAARGKEFSGGFAVADAGKRRRAGDLVEEQACFGGHAEFALTETCFDVLGSPAGERDFEVVDEGGAVERDAGNKAAAHQFSENRA